MKRFAIAVLFLASVAAVAPLFAEAPELAEMRTLMKKAADAFDTNHPAEAVSSYVAVLSLAARANTPESNVFADQARAELTKIGTMLSIEPGQDWVGPDGKQIAGSTRSVGKEGALNPSVYLYLNYGSGKMTLADFPIRFEFTRNAGTLNQDVTTNAYGFANTTITKLDAAGVETVVRAYPSFTVRGFTFAFKSVSREFSYLPPVNVARVVLFERSEFGTSENPQLLDQAVAELKPIGFELTPWNGALDSATALAAYQGQADALRKLFSGAGNASFVVFLVVDAAPAQQLTVGGVKRAIYTNSGTASIRIVRDDGTVVIALTPPAVKGQGGTAQLAADNCLAKLRKLVVDEIKAKLPRISEAFRK